MSFTYAVPDLHGRFDLLELAIAEITARGGGTVVFLGDYVDRGPASRQIIDRLIADAPDGQRWVVLSGNHEDMVVAVCRRRAPADLWIQNGGGATLVSYGHARRGALDLDVVPPEHVTWLDRLMLAFADEHRVYVHASVDPTLTLQEQSAKTLLWGRNLAAFDDGLGGQHVVHGHTPNKAGPELRPGRTNLDTLAWYTGRLCIGVFDDALPGGPIEILWIEGKAFEALTAEAA